MAEGGGGRGRASGIILAAGSSSRLGRPKQLLDLAGKPVLQHVIETLSRSPVDEIVVVIGHQAVDVATAVGGTGVRVAVNPDYRTGQSTSLRTGLEATGDESRAAVIVLGDQPGLRAEAVSAVVRAWRKGGALAVQAAYTGVPGHPVLFDRSIWPELAQAEGDEGARSILENHPEWRTLVEVGGSPPPDIDTEEDYERIRESFEGV
jgi:molybdenum cofactor cytidylyltransferase